MAEMLYYPDQVPPPDVLQHAVLFSDRLATVGRQVPDALQPLRDAGLHRRIPRADTYNGRVDGRLIGRLSKRMRRQYDPKELVYSDRFPGESTPDHRGQLFWNSFVGVPFRSVQVAEFAYELGYLPDDENARIACGLLVPHTVDLQLLKFAQEVQLWPPGQRSAPIQIHLGELLPTPDPGVPLAKLIAFRQRYEDERVELMEALDDLIHQVGAEHRTPEETLRVCARRLARASDDIRKAGRARQLMWVRNSVAVTVAAGSAASAVAFSQWQWLLGLLSGYAVNIATAQVGSAWTPGPFSYLHRVKRTCRK